MFAVINLKFNQRGFCHREFYPNCVDRLANSAEPDQTAPLEQSDLGLHCLHRPVCPKT